MSDGAVRGIARGSPCIRPISVHTFPWGQRVSSVLPEERWWKVTDFKMGRCTRALLALALTATLAAAEEASIGSRHAVDVVQVS